MSCYLNTNRSKFNLNDKFLFPAENMNQSDYVKYEPIRLRKIWTNQITEITEITDRQRLYIQHQLFRNFQFLHKDAVRKLKSKKYISYVFINSRLRENIYNRQIELFSCKYCKIDMMIFSGLKFNSPKSTSKIFKL